jgi:hypothetical protein
MTTNNVNNIDIITINDNIINYDIDYICNTIMSDDFINYNWKKYNVSDIISIKNEKKYGDIKSTVITIDLKQIKEYNFSEQILETFQIQYIKFFVNLECQKINDDEYKILFKSKIISPEPLINIIKNGEYLLEISLKKTNDKNRTLFIYNSKCIYDAQDNDFLNLIYNTIVDFLNNIFTDLVIKKFIKKFLRYCNKYL